jgi:hypothetical protein
MLITFLALWAMIPLAAQGVFGHDSGSGNKPATVKAASPVQGPARPESVVARLMSFDTNHDGRVTRAELPERMQPLFARADVTKDDALDGAEVLRLARMAPPQESVRGLQPGHYGFGEDSGFDTRLHIEGAIEDLRLASATREQALGIGRKFAANVKAQARTELMTAATPLLSAEQMTAFKAALDPKAPVIVVPQGATGGGAPNVEKLQSFFASALPFARQADLQRLVAQLSITPQQKQQLQVAVMRFKAHERLSDAERETLLKQMRAVLNDQERDDLRAALERRPIIKQGSVAGLVAARVIPPQAPSLPKMLDVPPQLQAQPKFGMQSLLLRQ